MKPSIVTRLRSHVVRGGWLAVLVLGTGLVIGALAPPAQAVTDLLPSAWPMYGHDPQHTFRSPLNGPITNELQSPTPIGNIIYSQAVVTLDGLFVFSAGFSTFGVSADGTKVWQSLVGAEASFSTATLDTNGFLYIGGRDNQLWKKDTEDGGGPNDNPPAPGTCKRYVPVDGDIKDGPTISAKFRDRVYVASGVNVYAISTENTTVNGVNFPACTIIWKSPPLAGTIFSSVSLAGATIPGDAKGHLVVASGSFVYLLDDNGASATIFKKSANLGMLTGPTPLVHPTTGNIYIGSMNKKFHGLKPDLTPLPNFPVDLGSRIWASAALSANGARLYVATDNGKLHARDAVTGQEAPGFPFVPTTLNRFTVKGYAPVVDGAGRIYIIGQDKFVRALNPNGTKLWERKINGKAAPATIINGGLIVPSWDHNLYRFCPNPSCS
jgi:hypothetical protein